MESSHPQTTAQPAPLPVRLRQLRDLLEQIVRENKVVNFTLLLAYRTLDVALAVNDVDFDIVEMVADILRLECAAARLSGTEDAVLRQAHTLADDILSDMPLPYEFADEQGVDDAH